MKFYLYRPDANSFAGIGFSSADDERIGQVHDADSPLAEDWITPVAHGFADNPVMEGDFPSLSNYWRIPVMSRRAWEVFYSLIGYCCEALQIVHPIGQPYFIIHVMETIDCLDQGRSEIRRSQIDGRVSRIFKYCFKPKMLKGKHIFKLPLESGGELIVDDEFRRTVEVNNLRGLIFKELPMTE